MLVNKSSTWLPDLNHDATANASFDDVSGLLDHLGKPDLTRHRGELSPLKLAFQTPPRRSPIGNRPHDGINAGQRTTAQDTVGDRGGQIQAARRRTGGNTPAARRLRETMA